MKKILITGKNSYIGTSVENWLLKEPLNYQVDTIDMKNQSWKEFDFSKYNVVFHVAGIAHIKENRKNKDLYYKVNRDLAYEAAKKAKLDGVKQFIFLSSMSVYGLTKGCITRSTIPNPKNAYGDSKLQAEYKIIKLMDDNFMVVILRPPMVYGPNCKGNYQKLSILAQKTSIFPEIENKRSMVYIDNLSEFIKNIIDDLSKGLFLPQNSEYVCTSEMVRIIAKVHGKKIYFIKYLSWILNFFPRNKVDKAFGSLIYKDNKDLIDVVDFEKSVIDCEK